MVQFILQFLAVVLFATLTWIIHKFLDTIAKKYKIDIEVTIEKLIDKIIEIAVRAAEEKVKKKGKSNSIISKVKQEVALKISKQLLTARGINHDDSELITRIDAMVNKLYHGERKREE